VIPPEVLAMSPLEIMSRVMHHRYAAGDHLGALVAAQAAAPYVHPRLQMTDVTVRHSAPGKSDEQLALEIEALRRRIEAARAAEAVPTLPLIEAQPVQSVVVSPTAPEGEQVAEPEIARVSE
jgi:hypothetical protein